MASQMIACKKNHVCECKNSNGTYIAGVIESTPKRKAKKSCEDMSQENTECYISESYK